MRAKTLRSPKRLASPAALGLIGSITKDLSITDSVQKTTGKTGFADLAPFKRIIQPVEKKKKVPTRNSAHERPGRHSRNLAGPEGSMNSGSKIALTSPKNLNSPTFSFQKSPNERSPEATMRHFNFDTTKKRKSPKKKFTKSEPLLNRPCRMYPPEYLKSPLRTEFEKKDEGIHIADGNNLREKQIMTRKKIDDFAQIANACRRQGRIRGEGHAYFSMGVIYDNLEEYEKAAKQYDKYLKISSKMNDVVGESLAHNCLGISYFKLAKITKKPEYFEKATTHHSQHCDMGDMLSKFIAHTNLGLVYNQISDQEKATKNHEHALRHAIRMSDISRQSIAIGHLGLTGYRHGDLETARACMERHLELVSQLGNNKARETALMQLGEVAGKQSDHKAATLYYHKALKLAQALDNKDVVDVAKVKIGIITGEVALAEKMAKLSTQLKR